MAASLGHRAGCSRRTLQRPEEIGTFTLTLKLPSLWTFVGLKLTGPAGHGDLDARFEPTAAPCHVAPC